MNKPKFKVTLYSDGYSWDLDEIFDSWEEADDAGLYEQSCASLGAEILHESNLEEPDSTDLTYEVVEI